MIGNDEIGAGALDARQNFQRHTFFVDPAVARSGLHHRILAADVVSGDRQVEFLAHAVELFKWRGTCRGLKEFIRIVFELEIEIQEHEVPFSTLNLEGEIVEGLDTALIKTLLEQIAFEMRRKHKNVFREDELTLLINNYLNNQRDLYNWREVLHCLCSTGALMRDLSFERGAKCFQLICWMPCMETSPIPKTAISPVRRSSWPRVPRPASLFRGRVRPSKRCFSKYLARSLTAWRTCNRIDT